MVHSRAASRYVKSLLDLAVERNALEEVHRDMQMVSRVASESRDFQLLLQSPIIKHDKKLAILKAIFKGKVHSLTAAFFEIITRKNREPILLDVARAFHNAYNAYKGIGKATVTTAIPIDAGLRAQFDKLARNYSDQKSIELIERVDPELIGGFVLEVGDRQVDASIKSKIKSLQVKFSQNPFTKEL